MESLKPYFWLLTESRGCTGGRVHNRGFFVKLKDRKIVRVGHVIKHDPEMVCVDWYESFVGDTMDEEIYQEDIPLDQVQIEDRTRNG